MHTEGFKPHERARLSVIGCEVNRNLLKERVLIIATPVCAAAITPSGKKDANVSNRFEFRKYGQKMRGAFSNRKSGPLCL